MANRREPYFVRSPVSKLTQITGWFTPAASSIASSGSWLGTRIHYTNTGIVTISLKDSYAALESAQFTLSLTGSRTTGSYSVYLDDTQTTVTSTTAPQVVVRTTDGGVLTNFLGSKVYFTLNLRNSSGTR